MPDRDLHIGLHHEPSGQHLCVLLHDESALPHLEEESAIVNTGSITGLEGSKQLLDYASTKGGFQLCHWRGFDFARRRNNRGLSAVRPLNNQEERDGRQW